MLSHSPDGRARSTRFRCGLLMMATCLAGSATPPLPVSAAPLSGTVVDDASGQPLAARVYLQGPDGAWLHVETTNDSGQAVPYRVERGTSTEVHTAITAHPFRADVPPGTYRLTVERGKQFVPWKGEVIVTEEGGTVEVRLRRWIDLARAGWYSGDTHVHRPLDELPTIMLADDLNVAFPLSYWVTAAGRPPSQGDKSATAVQAEPLYVDSTHVIYPLNTEYEIFTVGNRRHTLGAVFALNHREVLDLAVPPVRHVAEEVHRQGGLLELDKHNWPWSMMIVPVMQVDLYELTNNHLWRAPFMFRDFGVAPPAYMQVDQDAEGLTEQGWIEFTFQNYYALLNHGYRLRPTAGTASGVHPVPLGFGRVFVYLPQPFTYEGWVEGLDAGRSFVTTGPLLSVQCNDQLPGHVFSATGGQPWQGHLTGWARALDPIERLEILVNGQVVERVAPRNRPLPQGGFDCPIRAQVRLPASGWIAVRCFARTADGRLQFAHSGPLHVEHPDGPLRPRPEETQYLVGRMDEELQRNRNVLPAEALQEYEAARAAWMKRAGLPE